MSFFPLGELEVRVSGHCQYGSEFPRCQVFTSGKSLPATAAANMAVKKPEEIKRERREYVGSRSKTGRKGG